MAIINSVIVSGGGSAPAHYIEKTVDANGVLQNSSNCIDLTGVTDIGDYVLAGAYKNNGVITGSVDMSDLTTISGICACLEMFNNSMITGFDLSALTTVSGDDACNAMFNGSYITSANLPALTTISGNWGCAGMFQNTPMLTSANLPALTTISGDSALSYMFYNCPLLTTVYIGGTTAINFGTYTNQFDSVFDNSPQNIDVYAPAASQSQIESFSGYPNFGATGTVTWHWRS